jgi:hypothetical protein
MSAVFLHKHPILDKITQPFYLSQQKLVYKKLFQTEVIGLRPSPNGFVTFFKSTRLKELSPRSLVSGS